MVIFHDPEVTPMTLGAMTTLPCWAEIEAGAAAWVEAEEEVEGAAVFLSEDEKTQM